MIMVDDDMRLAVLRWEHYRKELTSHRWMRKVKRSKITNEIESAFYECIDCRSIVIKKDFNEYFSQIQFVSDERFSNLNNQGIGYLFLPCGKRPTTSPIECDSLLVRDIIT